MVLSGFSAESVAEFLWDYNGYRPSAEEVLTTMRLGKSGVAITAILAALVAFGKARQKQQDGEDNTAAGVSAMVSGLGALLKLNGAAETFSDEEREKVEKVIAQIARRRG